MKRGILRILEASISIFIIAGFLFLVFNRNTTTEPDASQLARDALEEMSRNNTLRNAALSAPFLDTTAPEYLLLNASISRSLNSGYNYELKICEVDDVCGKSEYTAGNVYSAERVIGSSIDEGYKPRKVKLFVWRK